MLGAQKNRLRFPRGGLIGLTFVLGFASSPQPTELRALVRT